MSNVVFLKPDRRRVPREEPAASGQIVFFTGVRYVRYVDEDEAVAPDALPAEAVCNPDTLAPAERLQA